VQEVRAIVFDYYYTLANPDPTTKDALASFLAKHVPSMGVDEFLMLRSQHSVVSASSAGTSPAFETFRQRWVRWANDFFAFDAMSGFGDAFADARRQAHALAPLFPDVRESLTRLAANGYHVGVLSDADTD
jgi:phosphoglycolate phosphatase-like HAD superfamily hydrolase